MKICKINAALLLLLLSLAVNSCDLDEIPEGDTLTEEQKKEIIKNNPDRLEAEVNALYSGMTSYADVDKAYYEFGIPSIVQLVDISGQDMFSIDNGYNMFRQAQRFTDRISQGILPTHYIWVTYYRLIKTANDILNMSDSTSTALADSIYKGQAYAARAYCYLSLVQVYQFTYDGHEDSPAVPIVTEKMTEQEVSKNPRATVKAVYAQIMNDLDRALALLKDYKRDAASKQVYNANVVYGLRARANLLMHNWKEAADDAAKAMEGFTPYTLTDLADPTLNKASAPSWIWAVMITENDAVVTSGVINWPGYLCSMTGKGYTKTGKAWRFINSKLWEQIPASDVRKSWWLDKDTTSKMTDPYTMTTANKEKVSLARYFGWEPYTNVKFGPYNDEIDNPTNASDWCLMRAEEMILIQAEALARSGDLGAGKSVLENFVKNNRDPEYTCKAASVDAFCDEVWFQRRVELWGEGFSFLDLMRLKKPVERKGTNYPPAHQYNLPAESPIFLQIIPETETNMNEGIPESANNPIVPTPTPN